ncbi:hypothetical protein ABKN59_002874 [Abortiporus biennis]
MLMLGSIWSGSALFAPSSASLSAPSLCSSPRWPFTHFCLIGAFLICSLAIVALHISAFFVPTYPLSLSCTGYHFPALMPAPALAFSCPFWKHEPSVPTTSSAVLSCSGRYFTFASSLHISPVVKTRKMLLKSPVHTHTHPNPDEPHAEGFRRTSQHHPPSLLHDSFLGTCLPHCISLIISLENSLCREDLWLILGDQDWRAKTCLTLICKKGPPWAIFT